MTRCTTCGRPDKAGELLPREILCRGCPAIEAAALAEGKSAGEAKARAKRFHEEEEMKAYNALVRLRLERNAAGKHALRPTEDLKDFTDAKGRTVTVAQFKARAQAALDAMDAAEAER